MREIKVTDIRVGDQIEVTNVATVVSIGDTHVQSRTAEGVSVQTKIATIPSRTIKLLKREVVWTDGDAIRYKNSLGDVKLWGRSNGQWFMAGGSGIAHTDEELNTSMLNSPTYYTVVYQEIK